MRVLGFLRSLRALLIDSPRLDGEIREELGSHIQHRADDLERRGSLAHRGRASCPH